MKNIIFIAPPAAGKGTQSDMLTEKYGYNHISTGDILRKSVESGSEIGLEVKSIMESGKLVSDDIMIKLIKETLNNMGDKPFILDGFPRTLNQAIVLEDLLKSLNKDYVTLYLSIDLETAMKRALGRLTCSCGKSYNIYEENLKPKVEGICDSCKKELIKRNDDNEESFKVRFNTFLENNEAIFNFYKEKNKLFVIDVNKSSSDVFNEIEKVVISD